MTQIMPVSAEALKAFEPLEFILLLGYGDTGKSYAILQLARAWQAMKPEGKVFAIDIETGIMKTWKKAFPDISPDRFLLWHGEAVDNIEKFLVVLNQVWPVATPNDFLCIESDTRIWDGSQDLAWARITGQHKDEYLSARLASGGKAPVTPQPDNLWQIALDAYRRRFRDVLTNTVRLRTNILITTGLSRPGARVSPAKRDAMNLLGIDIVPDGHSENVRNPDTVVMMTKDSEGYFAEVLKDRGYSRPAQRIKFSVGNFYLDFLHACRRG